MGIPAVTLEPEAASFALPSAVNGTYSWMSQAFSQDCLWTDGPTQYAVWVDDSRKGRIARRTHTRDWEASIDLSTVTATALSAAFDLDSHNVICVGVDERGYVHVSGNHHSANTTPGSQPLKYMRTTQPGSLNSWVAGSMVGTEEGNVTYPQFVRTRLGALLFFYRDGMSGNGDLMCNRFNSATRTWARVAKVIDGKADTCNAYPQRIAVDRTTGRIHLMWTWRDGTGGAEFNTDICYAYSDDDGVTWRRTDGTSYSLPITLTTGEVIIDIPAGPILNNGGLDVDQAGRPHAAILVQDGGGIYQIRHVYHDGVAWHYDLASAFTVSNGRRPSVACFAGRTWIIFNHSDFGGQIWALDVTVPSAPLLRSLFTTDVLTYEPHFDSTGLATRDRLYLPAVKERSAGALEGDPADLGAQLGVPILAVR